MVGVRREIARSDDPDYASGSSTSVTIEEWVARKDVFRVVAQGVPMMPAPVFKRCDPKLEDLYTQEVEARVAGVLRQHDISCYLPPRLDYWHPRYEKHNGENTLLIETLDTDTGSWLVAARQILSILRLQGVEMHGKFQVEIRSRDKYYDDISKRLPDDPQLLDALSKVEPGIISAVCSLMEGSWSSIAYHSRISRADNAYDVFGKPTVVVFCYPGSTCDHGYDKAEESLLEVLQMSPVDIHLEILPGEITPCVSSDNRPCYLSNPPPKPLNGSSTSVGGETREAGTLGGWVILNLPNLQTIQCGLTCYNVVKSPDKAITAHTDIHGVVLDDSRGHITVQYPAAYDAAYTLARLNEHCFSDPNDKTTAQELQTLSAQFANAAIGKVVLASGYRDTDGHRSDWALFESPSTFSVNKPPPEELILAPFQGPSNPPFYSQNRDSKVREFGRAKFGDWVTKIGRGTTCTTGEVNHMKRVMPAPLGGTTKQLEILSHDGNFAGPGDSGSMVIGPRGELLGIVTNVDTRSGSFDPAFITTIQQIQQDVKEMTGGGFLSLD
ncbi:hypothetical protein FQN54_002457 [Arachnomyces sp. PD_36]|nr:hypothetical protein FQN54_002457 [Arachnomyces sp. PD_36]